MYNLITTFGCRPDAIKMMPLIRELRQRQNLHTVVLSTGQHGDLLAPVYRYFDVIPDYDLQLMKEGQSLSDLTSSILKSVEPILDQKSPDMVLVHGDTATAYAITLACYYKGIPVGHVEAGLRTYNLKSPFPEEFYRQEIDKLSVLRFAPTEIAYQNLLNEGYAQKSLYLTGNTVVDAMQYPVAHAEAFQWSEWTGNSQFILLTAHRRENLGESLQGMFRAIRRVMEEHPACKLVYPVHPNPKVQRSAQDAFGNCSNILLLPPQDFASFRQLEQSCYLCLTDSGGVQEECSALGKPALVLRDFTERPEGIAQGPLALIGTKENDVYSSFTKYLDAKEEYAKLCQQTNIYGDGHASQRIADILEQFLNSSRQTENYQ